MEVIFDLAVVGGGPAGSAAAITAARQGAKVVLLERGHLPRHRVCGEFISPESLALLASLLGPGSELLRRAPRILQARVFGAGRSFQTPLPQAAVSISRYALDDALWEAAAAAGADCRLQVRVDDAEDPVQDERDFLLPTSHGTLQARTVINASGRWSNLRSVHEVFERTGKHWVGLKAHFSAQDFPASVDLYFFAGGYCGVQPVGVNLINVCAMVRSGLARNLEQVLAADPQLARASRAWKQQTELVTTAPLFFRQPEACRGAVCNAGDAAGFVDPFAGDGISLALRTGAQAAESLSAVWRGGATAAQAARAYRALYEQQFLPIFRASARVRRLLSLPAGLRRPAMFLLKTPGVAQWMVRATRGRIAAAV